MTHGTDAARLCQLVGLHLLDALAEVCAAHGLRYQLAGGTLLGALRQGGFIEWDDDVDTMMPRADFERLRQVAAAAPESFGPEMTLVVGADHIGRLVLTSSSSARGPLRLDIFPLDAVPAAALPRVALTTLFWWAKTAESVTWGDWRPTGRQSGAATALRPIARVLGRARLRRWQDQLTKALASASDGTLCNVLVGHRPIFRVRPTAWHTAGRTERFEQRELPVPLAAEDVLVELYGPDWREPPTRLPAPHYPPPLRVRLGDVAAEVG